MSSETVDHQHGAQGDKPPQDQDFQDGEYPNPEHFDWFWDQVPDAINDHAERLDSIDSDGDGKVDVADTADEATDAENVTSTYKDNDIDSDGDGVVDKADETRSFDSRTNYPTDPSPGQVVFRTDKT